MTLLLIGIATGISTFVGGSLALRFNNRIHLILGFSAGAVIGVALFDLLTEALSIGQQYYPIATITATVGIGFMAYMLLDRIILITTSKESGHRGHVGAGSLTIHSFLDGLGIGLAFQVSTALGAIVAVAVLVHDFSDGINTVNLSLFGTGKPMIARFWLIADALAPLVGIGATLFFKVPEQHLSLILALFSGFFLYIGASELLPDSHHRYPRLITSVMTLLGAALIYVAIHFAG
ncbi:MAG: ZIP family metal transporter [Candidatus Pacebacteria bacterium]|nr:ZIP family metal transporter [Candidatus Paceibacterota bacterium]